MTNSIDSGYTDSNESFDLFHQNLTIIGPDNTVIIINMDDIHDYMRYAVEVCTNRGSQIGVSVIVLAVLLLVTKAEKRRLPVFILNTLSLLINIPRTILQVVYFTSAWYDSFAYFTGDLSRVPHSAYASTCAADILTLLLVICIEMSLLVQVWTVSTGAAESYRFLVMALSISAALAAVALRFAITIINIRTTLYPFEPTSYLIPTIAPAAQIAAACSIVLFASIFCAKLGYALLRRRRLGLTQFGPMQVIFIMSCQTMAIPALFSVLQFISTVPELGTQALTLTTIFLPLSSIWAAAAISNSNSASDARPMLAKTYRANSISRASGPKSAISDLKTEKTLV